MNIVPFLIALALPATAMATEPAQSKDPHRGTTLPANPHSGMIAPARGTPAVKLTQQATVVSHIDVPQYTYIEVSQNKKTRWIAATTVAVKKGDVIRFDDGMVMTNFYSKTLKRTFPSIAFVNHVAPGAGK